MRHSHIFARLSESAPAPKVETKVVEALPVIKVPRMEHDLQCPHCKEIIHEKGTYHKEGIDYHGKCEKPIQFPAPTPEEAEWLAKFKAHLERK